MGGKWADCLQWQMRLREDDDGELVSGLAESAPEPAERAECMAIGGGNESKYERMSPSITSRRSNEYSSGKLNVQATRGFETDGLKGHAKAVCNK